MSTHFNPILAILGFQPFFFVAALAAIALIGVAFLGAARWEKPNGKALTVVAGLLLLLLAGFVAVVLYIAHGARTGAPM